MAEQSLQSIPPGFQELEYQGISEEFFLNMGPQHPSTHGVLKLVLRLDGETILDVVPHLGFIHRGIEKMGESQTYLQYIHLTDRMDYLSSHINNLGVCMAIEKGMGMGVPERAEFIRVIVCELQRIQSHLLFWGVFGMDLGAITAFLYGFKERERITALFEKLCGARLTMNFFRPGGSYADLPNAWLEEVTDVLENLKRTLDEHDTLLTKNIITQERTKGIGILSAEDAIDYACTGPMLRASGVKYDLRKSNPYSVYELFDFDVPTGMVGDSFDRYMVRVQEMRQSIRIVEQAIEKIPSGQYRSKEKNVYSLPEGEYFSQVETARGIFGTYFVAKKGPMPYRVKTRSPSLSNLAPIAQIAKGFKVADIVTILSTIDIVVPDIDR